MNAKVQIRHRNIKHENIYKKRIKIKDKIGFQRVLFHKITIIRRIFQKVPFFAKYNENVYNPMSSNYKFQQQFKISIDENQNKIITRYESVKM